MKIVVYKILLLTIYHGSDIFAAAVILLKIEYYFHSIFCLFHHVRYISTYKILFNFTCKMYVDTHVNPSNNIFKHMYHSWISKKRRDLYYL